MQVCLVRFLKPIPKLLCNSLASPKLLGSTWVCHELLELDLRRERFEEDSYRLRIVNVLVSELSNKLRKLSLPSYEAFDRVETLIVRLYAYRYLAQNINHKHFTHLG